MSHLKGLVSDSLLYSLPPVISSVGNLILLPIYTAYLSPWDYGILTMLTVSGNLMSMLVWLNMNSGVLRFYHEYEGEQRRRFLGTMAIASSLYSLLTCGLLFVFGSAVTRIFFSSGEVDFIPYMAAQIGIVFAGSSVLVAGGILKNQRKSGTWSLIQLAGWALTTGLTLYFIVVVGEGAWGKVKSQLIVAAILYFVYWGVSLKYLAASFSWRMCLEAVWFGIPLLLRSISNYAFQYSGRWILERNASLSQVGLYGFSDSVAQLLRVPSQAFSTAWMPVFYKEATADVEAAKGLTKEMSFYWAMSMLSLTLAFCLNIKPLIILLVNVRYQVDVVYQGTVILALGYFLGSLQVFFIYNLGFMKKTMPIFLASLLAAILNLVLNLSFIPTYGILAAAWATVAAYSISLLMLFIMSQRIFRMSFNWAPFGRGLLLALATYGISCWVGLANPWASLAANTGLFVLYLASLLLLGVVRPAKVKEAWNRVAAARD